MHGGISLWMQSQWQRFFLLQIFCEAEMSWEQKKSHSHVHTRYTYTLAISKSIHAQTLCVRTFIHSAKCREKRRFTWVSKDSIYFIWIVQSLRVYTQRSNVNVIPAFWRSGAAQHTAHPWRISISSLLFDDSITNHLQYPKIHSALADNGTQS